MKHTTRRYSGNDKHFGPFTWSTLSVEGWRPWGITLDSGGGTERDGVCHVLFHLGHKTLICELPKIIPDYSVRHIASTWDAATVERLGRNWYDEIFPREYGFTISDGSVFLRYGPQTHDSVTTKSKVIWIPWKQMRHVRFSLYDLEGKHFWSQRKREDICGIDAYDAQRKAQAECPKCHFVFADYDGQIITAATQIHEREWHHGIGWFKWLSWFRKPFIRRTLDIEFSKEVGPEKGSWKGGTTGTGIDMLPGELHEDAFRRYCDQEHRAKYRNYTIQYIGRVEQKT